MEPKSNNAGVSLPDELKQESVLREFLHGDRYWTDVYLSEGIADGRAVYASFAPPQIREELLADYNWDCHIGDGTPGFTQYGDGRVEYFRHGCEHDRMSPLVIVLSNSGIGPKILPEIAEEFRHLMELRPNREHTEFHRLLDDGSLELAAEVSESCVRIRTKYLRQYQAAKQLDLVRYIDSRVWAPGDHTASFEAEFGCEQPTIIRPDRHFCMWPFYGGTSLSRDETVTVLMGKKVIPAPSQEHADMWPWDRRDAEDYGEFIIDEDEYGQPIMHTCDHNQLGPNTEAGTPDYLTPVWFDREVLRKYYADTDKYEVTDGYLSCGGLWGVQIDNDNSDGNVMVWLGDIGRDIPAGERGHWKAYNIFLPRPGSDTYIRRQLLGQFASAQSPAFAFKREYARFRDAWRNELQWELLRELTGANAEALERLRTPLNGTVKEFEDLVKDLNLVLVESLDSRQLKSRVQGDTKDLKSIGLLERWLEESGYPSVQREISFLRTLQSVRSQGSHLRSSEYEERLRKLGVGDDRVATIHGYYGSGTTLLNGLSSHFLKDRPT